MCQRLTSVSCLLRVSLAGMYITRPSLKVGRYKMIKHKLDKGNDVNPKRYSKWADPTLVYIQTPKTWTVMLKSTWNRTWRPICFHILACLVKCWHQMCGAAWCPTSWELCLNTAEERWKGFVEPITPNTASNTRQIPDKRSVQNHAGFLARFGSWKRT